ncbi:Stage V sporulation protein K [Anatilimnocola aggregata]|uniref:Stage V sporulation protein K n=1 Tax=Anatilimnocola aggregata TaxID=2528021 RepID=A0A517YII7_9BACT|nr:AAA family ATPase [Anatilimnocola aggregata]QDU30043.1 Stage V sporulation protein K [Anatilimnocola aggregata]
MTLATFDDICHDFDQTLLACRELYVSSAHLCLEECPHLVPGKPEAYVELLDNLHRGLLLKIFSAVASSDRICSAAEQKLAARLLSHAWEEGMDEHRVREVLPHVITQASGLSWYSLVRPFDVMPPLQQRVGELETIVMRIANLTAKADGVVSPVEAGMLKSIQGEIDRHLKLIPLDDESPSSHKSTTAQARARDVALPNMGSDGSAKQSPTLEKATLTPQEQIAAALAELDALIGLTAIKQEVRTLVNVLQLQRQRQELGLPQTPLSLHLVFRGNPGTGKTTVARIIGRIYAALGMLEKGHLVEVDRSALVAEFAGQTGPKTHRKIDEAIGGLLFIDEAYSLVAPGREDPYGHEAVQALLKRMEDDRHRLAVILAGYPEPLAGLLTSNPGLSSRFNTNLTFDDYGPGELAQIFRKLCEQNQYRVVGAAQARLLLALAWLHEERDEHFGNGRLVRNVFEQSIRRLANRVASIAPMTKELLTTFEAADIAVQEVPESALTIDASKPPRLRIACPHCSATVKTFATWLGQIVRCPKCEGRFVAEWGEPVRE